VLLSTGFPLSIFYALYFLLDYRCAEGPGLAAMGMNPIVLFCSNAAGEPFGIGAAIPRHML